MFIDKILMSILEETFSGIITCDMSDHLPIFIMRKNDFTKLNSQYQSVFKTYRNTNAGNLNKVNSFLSYRISSFSFS